ncbi:hypothetical protein [Kitasatospora sp. NPDC088783]|uniref:hypothetical protein n=1 Tax=Kitasatospora sp. NPDC088783 TaxID=3364077 RepID=UPI00383036B1
MTTAPLTTAQAAALARVLMEKASTNAGNAVEYSTSRLASWELDRTGTARAWQCVALALVWRGVADRLAGGLPGDDRVLVEAVLAHRRELATAQVRRESIPAISPVTLLDEESRAWARTAFLRDTDEIEPDRTRRWFAPRPGALL